jgi:N-acetylglucosamine repressor
MGNGDVSFIKNINKQLVLNLIRNYDFISAPELSKTTGLRPSTILNILNDFLSQELIIDAGKGQSTNKGGKRPSLWRLNKSFSYTIGLDIEIGQIIGVILNLSAETVHKSILKIEPIQNLAEAITHINTIVNNMLTNSKIPKDKILGMGIACAGVVNRETGTMIISEIISEMNLPFLSELQKHYTFPIIIENNANACAQGSKWLGVAKEKKNLMAILVEFDTDVGGIGIGIIINNELYHGSSFCAGELNIHLPKLRDMLENIRNRFHESPILKNYALSPEKIDIDLMISAAEQEDELAITFFSIFGNLIGKSIASSIALLNPDALIIMGDISSLGEIIVNPIRNAIELEILSISNANLEILCDSNGHYSVAKGSASLILNDFFQLPNINNHQQKFMD